MALSMPYGHKPRFKDFDLISISDETIREGLERALFGARDEDKLALVEMIACAGIKDIDMGSGLQEAKFLLRCLNSQCLLNRIPQDVNFLFNLTLKTWEPLKESLKIIPRKLLEKVHVSIGMVEFQEEKNLLAKAHGELFDIGIRNFRSSILNAFDTEIDNEHYDFICRQIERVKKLGIGKVRINDSVGTLYPDVTAILAANLVNDFSNMTFYLHSHDDRGLGLANSLSSVFHGFQMIEGGIAGFGNRAGLANIEVLNQIFIERNITVNGKNLDPQKLKDAAGLAEKTFIVIPDVYRPVSGLLVENENAGIVNVPDYLNVKRPVKYFVNQVGLFDDTVRQILKDSGMLSEKIDDPDFISKVTGYLVNKLDYEILPQKQRLWQEIHDSILSLYSGILRIDDVEKTVLQILHQQAVVNEIKRGEA